MATSAAKLSQIINCLCTEYELDEKQVLKQLSTKDLLPAKLLEKPVVKSVSIFASKIAEALATQAKVVVEEGKGSGKDGKFTLIDIKTLIQQPTKNKLLVSPTAMSFANDHGINVTNIVGTGKDGRILLKDVEKIVETTADEELNISPRAQVFATKENLSEQELKKVKGSGKDGKILLKDIEKMTSDSESDSESDSDSDSDSDSASSLSF